MMGGERGRFGLWVGGGGEENGGHLVRQVRSITLYCRRSVDSTLINSQVTQMVLVNASRAPFCR